MAILYYGKQAFPHVSLTINDLSVSQIAGTPTSAQGRMLMGIFANKGPDDRTLYVRTEGEFFELFGKQVYNKHNLMGKACIKALRRGGHVIVRRLTDSASKNANASLDVLATTPTEARTIYFDMKKKAWVKTQPTGAADTDYVALSTTAPTIEYTYNNHTGLKTKSDAELVTISKTGQVDQVPLYVLMRTGAGSVGNKTKIVFGKTKTLSNNKDNAYSMDIIMGEDDSEKYRINAVVDSRYETTPLNIKEALNKRSFQLNVHSSEANHTKLEELITGAITQLVEDLETLITASAEKPTVLSAMTSELAKVVVIQEALANADVEPTALTSMFGINDRFPIISQILETGNYITEVKLAGGTNGQLLQGKFDWNLTVEEDGEQVKIYEKLMKEFIDGTIDPNVLDFNLTPADFFPDLGFPVPVKETLSSFTMVGKRRDVLCTIAPSKAATVTELKSFDEGFKINNYNAFKMPNWADVYDTDELKTITVPVTYLAIDTIFDFINDGWSDPPLSGRVVPGPIEGTVIPQIDILNDVADKTYLVQNGWNYLNSSTVGYILDGQMGASTDPETVSVLQEFHNAYLITRVIKKITDVLNRNKHFLAKDGKVEDLVARVNKELEEFTSKAATITYSAYYADEFDYKEGILTDKIDMHMWITNKSHSLVINALRYVMALGEK